MCLLVRLAGSREIGADERILAGVARIRECLLYRVAWRLDALDLHRGADRSIVLCAEISLPLLWQTID